MERFKKLFAGIVMVTTILSLSVVVGPTASAASAGDLIKMDGLSSVYYLAGDGKRYVFPNEATFFSWYGDFSSVKTISQSELEALPLGANVTIRPGTKLVKITTNPKVYAVETNGSLVAIPDEATATTLFGANWAKRVVDVPDGFFSNYKISTDTVSATAYPEGSLIKTASSPDIYYILSDGTARKIATEAAFTGNRFKFDDVITTTLAIPATGSDITAAETSLTDTSSGAGGTIGAGSGLTVALASDTAASAVLPAGAAGVPFTKINFTAASDGAVTLKNITVTRTGIGVSTNFAGVWLYDGDGNRLTSQRTISASSNTAIFSGVNFNVPAGQTKALVITATVSGTSGSEALGISAATGITTDGASVSGSFPIMGNLMSLSSVVAGAVTYTLQSVANSTLDVGDLQQEVANIKIAETSSNEDVILKSITFTNDGAADPNDLKNFKLYQGSTLVAELASTDTDRARLALTSPLTIKKGSSKNFSLKADIMGGVSATAISMDIDDLTDVVATGATYGFGVAVTAGGTAQTIAVEAGELTFELDGPAAKDAVADQEDVVLANLTVTTGSEEAVEVNNLYGVIDCTDVGAATVMETGLENVQLVNVDSNDFYDVTDDDDTANDDYYFKVTNFTIPAGASHWRVETDFNSTYIGNTDYCVFTMFAGDHAAGDAEATSNLKGIDAENKDNKALTDIKPAADLNSNRTTIRTGSLAIANVTLGNTDTVAKTKGVELLRFTAEAGSAESAKITAVALVASSTTANLTDAANYSLFVVGDTTALQSGVSAANATSDTVTFSSLRDGGYTIPKSETKTFYVTADINSTVVGSQITVDLADDGVTAEDSDGDDIAAANVTGDDAAHTSATIQGGDVTLHTKGSIAFTVDNSSPSTAHALLSGSTDNTILKFKADASYEDITLNDLRFSVSGTNATTSIASVSLYQDGVLKKAVDTKTDAYGWVFNNLEALTSPVVVKAATDSIFELKLNTAGIGTGVHDTAASGADITLTLLPTTTGVAATGFSSNNDLVAGDITITSVATQANYVYGSKVTAVESTSQPTSLSTGVKEVLKFTLAPSTNNSKEALFSGLTVNFGFTGGAATTTSIAYLYSGSTLIGTSTIIGAPTSSSASTFLSNGVAISDTILGSGETYTIKMDLTTDGADDQVTASIGVNGGRGNDDITWTDFSGGTSVAWIDLGESSDITNIENIISN